MACYLYSLLPTGYVDVRFGVLYTLLTPFSTLITCIYTGYVCVVACLSISGYKPYASTFIIQLLSINCFCSSMPQDIPD